MTLPAFAAECPRLLHGASNASAAVDRYILPAWRLAANPPTVVAAVDRRDRQKDGRTDARPLHRPCSAYCAGSVKNRHCKIVSHFCWYIGARKSLLRYLPEEWRNFPSLCAGLAQSLSFKLESRPLESACSELQFS